MAVNYPKAEAVVFWPARRRHESKLDPTTLQSGLRSSTVSG